MDSEIAFHNSLIAIHKPFARFNPRTSFFSLAHCLSCSVKTAYISDSLFALFAFAARFISVLASGYS